MSSLFDNKKYTSSGHLSLENSNLVKTLDRLVNFENGILNNNNVYRITPTMLSQNNRDKIRFEILGSEGVDIIEINQKDGLYKIFRSYIDKNPIGYILYRISESKGFSYLFDEKFKLIDRKYMPNPKFTLEPLQILPTDWLKMRNEKYDRAYTDLDKEFVDRTNFENFTIENLALLEKKIENSINIEPTNDRLKSQLITLLMQKVPDSNKLQTALELYKTIKDEDVKREFKEVRDTIIDMLKPQLSRSSITRINWGIFNRCPLTCRGCYNIFNTIVLPLDECKKILDKIANSGTTELIISGGDPLLWPDLVEFCSYAKNRGLKIGIDTVSYNLNKNLLYNIKDLISYIGIPLDGADQETIETFRKGKKDLFDKVLHSLDLADSLDVSVRLNTTVSKRNIHVLFDIAKTVERHKSIKSWSIYQWWPLRAGDKLAEQMILEKEELDEAVSLLKQKHDNLKIFDRSVDKRERNTFFISSNGEVYTFGKSSQISTIIIGDIKKQNIKELLQNPALKKDSQKFMPIERFGSNHVEQISNLVA